MEFAATCFSLSQGLLRSAAAQRGLGSGCVQRPKEGGVRFWPGQRFGASSAWTLALLSAFLLAAATGCVETRTEEATGEQLYLRCCASCHGTSGRGDGSLAASLVPPPTDLTLLAQRAGGKFDETAVMMTIDGRQLVVQHGPREMPVWGAVFAEDHMSEPFATYRPILDARALADYLRTFQRK